MNAPIGPVHRAAAAERIGELVKASRRPFLRQRLADAFPRVLEEGMPLWIVGGAAFLLLRIVFALISDAAHSSSLVATLGWVAAPYVLYVAAQMCGVLISRPRDQASIAWIDERFGLEERLISAREFVEKRELTAFEAATVEDALERVARADPRALNLVPVHGNMSSKAWRYPVAAGILIGIGLVISPGSSSSDDARVAEPTMTIDGPHSSLPRATQAASRDEVERRTNDDAPRSQQSEPRTGRSVSTSADEDTKAATESRTPSGGSSDAASRGSSAASRGDPSSQARPSAGSQQRKPVVKKPQKPRASETPTARKPKEKEGGATMSRGASSGGMRNPTVSEWSSKDEVDAPAEEPSVTDEDVEETADVDESRGGVQPNLRDRKPPPNRDLTIGLGSRPGGEGRGGPSPQKKQRGTAALVFGVPVPDHVKGRLNPGMTKITEERVRPEAGQSTPIDAEPRAARSLPAPPAPRYPADAALLRFLARLSLRTSGQTSNTQTSEKP